MNRRLIALVGLSILTVLAGCNGGMGPTTPTDTTDSNSPSPNGTTSGETSFNGVQLPEGTTATGISNEARVLSQHQSVLSSDSYRIAFNLTHAVAGTGGNTTTIVASNQSQQHLSIQSDLTDRTLEEYQTKNQSFTRTTVGNVSDIRASGMSRPFETAHTREARPGELLTTMLISAEFSATRTTTVDNHSAVVYNITDINSTDSQRLPTDIQQFNGSMTIDERGLIWEASLFTLGSTNGTIEVMLQEYKTLKQGSVLVGRPMWVQNESVQD